MQHWCRRSTQHLVNFNYQTRRKQKVNAHTSIPRSRSHRAFSTVSVKYLATIARTLQFVSRTWRNSIFRSTLQGMAFIIIDRVLFASSMTNRLSSAAFCKRIAKSEGEPDCKWMNMSSPNAFKKSVAHINAVLHTELLRLAMCNFKWGITVSRTSFNSLGW